MDLCSIEKLSLYKFYLHDHLLLQFNYPLTYFFFFVNGHMHTHCTMYLLIYAHLELQPRKMKNDAIHP